MAKNKKDRESSDDAIAKDEYTFRIEILQRLKRLETCTKIVQSDLEKRIERLERGVLGMIVGALTIVGGYLLKIVFAAGFGKEIK